MLYDINLHFVICLHFDSLIDIPINERDVIIWDVLIAITSRNILRKFLGWQSLIRHACQFKLQNVQRIIYQDLSGNNFATVFLGISRISAGVHERLSSIFVFCDRIWIKQKAQIFTFKIKALPTATKIPKSRKVNIFV
jgi:hypothetical protein